MSTKSKSRSEEVCYTVTMEERRARKIEMDSKYPAPIIKLNAITLEDGRPALEVVNRYLEGAKIPGIERKDPLVLKTVFALVGQSEPTYGYAMKELLTIINGIESYFKQVNNIPQNVKLR